MSGRSIGLKPVPLQSLSELERCRLQDVAFRRLLRDRDMGCHITIPKRNALRSQRNTASLADAYTPRQEVTRASPRRRQSGLLLTRGLLSSTDGHKHKKSLRQKLDSLSKEKSKDKGEDPPPPPTSEPCVCGELSDHNLEDSDVSEGPRPHPPQQSGRKVMFSVRKAMEGRRGKNKWWVFIAPPP